MPFFVAFKVINDNLSSFGLTLATAFRTFIYRMSLLTLPNIFGKIPERFARLVRYITEQIPAIQTVQLVKTIYLIELEYMVKFGEKLTEIPLVRLPLGPTPRDYMDEFRRVRKEGVIEIEEAGDERWRKFSPNVKKSYPLMLTDYEVEVISPVLEVVKKIIVQNPYQSSDTLKRISYETPPMVRCVAAEKVSGVKYGEDLFSAPYFTSEDIDPLASDRRSYREHIKRSREYTEEDAKESERLQALFRPQLQLTNERILKEQE